MDIQELSPKARARIAELERQIQAVAEADTVPKELAQAPSFGELLRHTTELQRQEAAAKAEEAGGSERRLARIEAAVLRVERSLAVLIGEPVPPAATAGQANPQPSTEDEDSA